MVGGRDGGDVEATLELPVVEHELHVHAALHAHLTLGKRQVDVLVELVVQEFDLFDDL